MTRRRFVRTAVLCLMALVLGAAPEVRLRAQDRFLGKEDIILLGLGLRVEPDRQVVPRDIATIVSTFLNAPTPPQGQLAPFSPDATVKGILRGPGVGNGLELTAAPNTPFNIPPLGVAGIYTLEDIRFESGGQVLMRGTPESVTIEVIDKLLVTQVTARALTAQEIRDKGIVFDKSNFQAYNFTAAFAVQDTPILISFPVVLPTLQGAQDATLNQADLGSLTLPTLPELKTIIPDTLRLQTQIPNLKVIGFTLKAPVLKGQQLVVPPIPGIVVIPGDIGFLNQFFSVMLLVGNVAPPGSNLVVTDLTGDILLPPGNDTVVGSGDDPLRMAQTNGGESPRRQLVVQAGADGKLGTADDIGSLEPGASGSAEYLVEGRREGTHVIEFNITGTLLGLPVGPVQVTGRAAGSVLVRNPTFTLTFAHPDTVAAGERYALDVTVTNTSESPANFVSVNLFSQNVSGATVVGDPSRQVDSIPPGDSATVSFELISRITGRVSAATLDADDKVQGRFSLKTAVGELGVPVSPDSLILPTEANGLPAEVKMAVLGLLGKAWAVATAPAAALPRDVTRFSKQIVFDRAVQAAEAGMRITLHEPVPDSVAQLAMDFIGSDVGRLSSLYPKPGDLPFVQADVTAFDELRRRSIRGDILGSAIGHVLAAQVATQGATPFHRGFAEKVSYRPAHLSVLVTSDGGPLPYTATLVDAQGRRLGGLDANGKVVKEIRFAEVLPLDSGGALAGQLLVLAAPDAGEFHLQFAAVGGVPATGSFTVSLVVPDGSGGLRQVVYSGLRGTSAAQSVFTSAQPYRVVLDLPVGGGGGTALSPSIDAAIVAPAPHVIGVIQQAGKDILSCVAALDIEGTVDIATLGTPAGRIIAVLFSEEVTAESVQDRVAATEIARYAIDNNQVVGVALQPGRRVAFLALRDPVGPFVTRQLTISGVVNGHGRVMATETTPIETTVTNDASVVSGQVLGADGVPVPFANVRLFVSNPCGGLVGISSKSADASGRFSWDWVPNSAKNRITAVTPGSDESRSVDFTSQRNGQRLNVNVVFLGRGILTGRALSEDGMPLAGTSIKVTSLTDNSSYGATTDDSGRFTIGRIPVGNILLEGVHVPSNARGSASELIPLAGASVVRDLTLFSLTFPKTIVKFGTATGHVLRADGASPVSDVPVIAYYKNNTQPGVNCPPGLAECAVGVGRTDAAGRFEIAHISAGQIHLTTFDQLTYQQGAAVIALPADGTADATLLLGQGLGTVNGTVLDADGHPVADARVGGGLSLTTTDSGGHFVLTDIPVGQRDIVAVSDALGTSGRSIIDIVQAGQTVNVTVVLSATGAIAGTVFQFDGVTPVPSNKVYLFYISAGGDGPEISVVATATTDAGGRYTMDRVALRQEGYVLSAFRADFSDGNVKSALLKFNNQVLRGDIIFRGGGGRVTGHVFDADGTTPLRAAVGITGDRAAIAGGLVGTGFESVANYQIVNTDLATGSFSFDNVLVGGFTLAAAGQFSPDPISIEGRMPTPGATVPIDLRLQDTSQIQGTVFQPDGVTPAGPDVVVRYKSSAFKLVCATSGGIRIGNQFIDPGTCADVPQGIQDETVVTDNDGRYLLPLVTAGTFTLTATDPSTGKTAQIAGAVRPGQTGDFSIRLLGLGTLTINVRGSNSITPIPNARVEVKQIAFPKKTFVGQADGAGTLVLNGGDAFSEGNVVVMATDPATGFAGRASGKVIKDGDNVVINVFLYNASGTVFGVVFSPDGLTPVPNAEVVISNCVEQSGFIGVGPAPCFSGGPLAFAVTDATGAYRQDLIPLGGVRIDVFEAATARRGYAAGRIDLDRQEVPLNVTQSARGLVTGTLFAAGSLAPLKNWEMALDQVSPGGRQLPSLQTTTGVDGTFSFPGVGVGSFRLFATKRTLRTGDPYGYAQAAAFLTTEGEHVDVPMVVEVVEPHHGRVEGTVVNPNGTPAANVSLDLCPVANCSIFGSGHLGGLTGADGSFAFDNVLIGRFSITAKSQTSLNATSGEGQLLFEGDTARLTLTLVGLSQVSGTVVFADGRAAPNVQVNLQGYPSSGCVGVGGCLGFTDANGAFTFINVSAKTFYLSATDPVTGLSGVVTGALNPDDHANVRVVLQATASVTGRVLFANGSPAPRVTAQLSQLGLFPAPADIFQVSDANGQFTFPAVPIGSFTLNLEDPIGPGIAHRSVQAAGAVALGDIVLDEAAPQVATLTPAASAVGVPLASTVRVVFSEPITVGSVNQSSVKLTGPTSTVLGTLQVTDGDTTATFTPLSALSEQTRYTLSIQGVTDRVGKTLSSFTASFTTVDLTPPSIADLTPAIDTNGVALGSVVRVKYSEPINPATYRGPPIVLSKGSQPVAGRTDFILGNTAVVFTPALPLDENTRYDVRVEAVSDLAGNAQPQGLSYSFLSFDRTPPQIAGLTAAGDGSVIENGTTSVVADVGTAHDIAVVDFFINDQPSLAARTTPFTLNFQATSALGRPGDRIKISALATDTSGNRGTVPAVTFVPIVADAPPVVTITAPPAGATFRTGERVTVSVHVVDDLGATQIAYRAQTGQPQDAAVQALSPTSRDTVRTFAFSIPADATPGALLAIEASGQDTKGQLTNAPPVLVTVLDATSPTVVITGTTTGARVSPGQQSSAIVSAQDLGGIASLRFTTGGVLSGSETRTVTPALNSVVTTFAFTVPSSAHAGDTLTLDATATDAAGNITNAARVLLPIADLNPPTLRLRTSTGSGNIAPGTVVTVVAEGEDETGINTVTLSGQGAFSVTQARQVSPVSNSIQLPFQIQVPLGAAEGSALNLSATAIDIFGNTSVPATLALTVRTGVGVTLPLSLLIAAGDAVPLTVELTAPAPAGGVRVDLSTTNSAVAQVTPSVLVVQGATSAQATLTGLTGGSTSVSASVGGVSRATMTVTVRGGIVSGTVVNTLLNPVPGATVVVSAGDGRASSTVTDGAGAFLVEGVAFGGPYLTGFAIRVTDPLTNQIGFATGNLNAPNGFAHVTVVVVTAGSISGTVRNGDGLTAVGAGARVDLFASNALYQSLATIFTDGSGVFEFPIVSPGTYVLEASDVQGNRGRSAPLLIASSGQHVDATVAFLGRGAVTGTVRDGGNAPVPNVPITLDSTGFFGSAPTINVNAGPDGTFRFDDVFVGTFTLRATDPITNLKGTASGAVTAHLQVVTTDVRLAQWGGLQGTVFRADGLTAVVGAVVSVSAGVANLTTASDNDGHYAFTALPLGSYSLSASEPGTHGIGRATGTLSVNALVVTQNVTFFAQGALVVTVTDNSGNPVPGASVEVTSNNGQAGDYLTATTDTNGAVLVEHVLASQNVTILGRANGLSAYGVTTLQANEVKPITIRLAPTGSIAGTVFLPDGQTPATGATVRIFGTPVPVNPDGTFRADNLTLRSWEVTAFDSAGRKRAVAKNVVLSQNGQVITVNLTFIGLGTVAGRVLNPDNSSAPNITVQVRSLDPEFGGFQFPTTNAAGFYQADHVAVGSLVVSAGDSSRGLLGEATGALAHDGDTLTLDVLLKNNAVNLPTTKSDGNFFPFDIQRDASVANGLNGTFTGYSYYPQPGGAFFLDLLASGTPNRFTGSTIGTTEANGREIVVTQNGLAGLNVTRKVLVSNSYFTRYLEVLSNPTASPITVDVSVQASSHTYSVLKTSTGDATLGVSDPANPDRWVVLNTNQDVDPFLRYATSQLAFGFDGDGAARRVSVATFAVNPNSALGVVNYRWNDVTVAPGQTVAFMHFGVQQYSRAAAEASVTRLAQLPPEALESLSSSEIGAIQNFAVPADGTSALAALPPLGGTITGRVLEADQTTPVSSISPFGGTYINLRYRSGNILFGRTYTGSSNSLGNFTFGGSTVTVPQDAFTLEADHPISSVTSPPTLGAFQPGSTTATANIVFSNTGIIRGTVRRTSGVPVVGTTLIVNAPALSYARAYPVTGSDGSYFAGGVPPGAVTVVAQIRHPQAYGNVYLTGSAAFTLSAGGTVVRDLTIQPTGTLTGTVRTALGAASVNTIVQVSGVDPSNPQAALQTQTDSAGVYRFNDVPLGALTVTTTDPGTYFKVTGGVTVLQDQTATRDLTLLAIGSVELTVTYANGLPADHAYVEIQEAALDSYFRSVPPYYTDANGRMTITGVPAGALVVRARRPDDYYVQVDVAATLTSHGQIIPLTAVLPPVGTVVVQVNSRTGTPAANVRVDGDMFYGPGNFQNLGNTDANGTLTIARVKGPGTFVLRAYDPQNGQFRDVVGAVTSEGQTLPVTITLNSAGRVSGRMTNADGSPANGVSLVVLALGGNYGFSAQTDIDGRYEAPDVPTGHFRVRSLDFPNQRFGSFEGELANDGDTVIADFSLSKVLLSQGLPLADANGFNYVVRQDGTVSGSWPADGFLGFPGLLVSPAGTESFRSFNGDLGGTPEQAGRQVAISNFDYQGITAQPLGGLTVTRKVFVDPTGYFGRFLEIFDNPTAAPLAVDVQVYGGLNASRLADTSSGDAELSAADRWFLTEHTGNPAAPRDVFVFEGADAALPVGSATVGTYGFTPTVRWNRLAVPAGGRAILMHFVSAEPDNAAARSAAERLAQAPPEALVGLTAADFAAIQNFAVPADASSTASPFGTVTGRVLAGQSAPVPNARVLVGGSSSPIFKPTITVQTDASGQYRATTLGVGPFTVQAQDPVTGEVSPAVSLSLGAGETIVTQDLVFANVGVLRGTVRLATGAPALGGQVFVTGGTPAVNIVLPIGAGGTYSTGALRPDTYTVSATSNGRSGSSGGHVVSAGDTAIADVTLQAIAQLRVTLKRTDGTPVASVGLYLADGNGSRYYPFATNANGVALIPGVVEGPFTLQTFNPAETFGGVVLPVQDGQTVDLTLTSQAGSISGTVRFAGGQPATSGFVQISPDGYSTIASSNIAADGSYAIDAIMPGTYTAFATFSGTTIQSAPVTVAAGQRVVLDIRLPGSVTLRVTVRPEGGAPIAGANVYIEDGNGFRYSGATDANGIVLIPDVREGAFTVSVYSYGSVRVNNLTKSGVVTAADNGHVVDFAVSPVVGSVSGHVFAVDGVTPVGGVSVVLIDAASSAPVSFVVTNALGAYEVANVGIETQGFRVVAHSPVDYAVTVEGAGSFAGAPVVIDLTLPIKVVRGTVFYADGVTPVSSAQVRVAQETASGDTTTLYRTADSNGAFSVAGIKDGPFEILATDSRGAVSGRASGVVAASSAVATLNVSLGPTGTVHGAVRDAAANPIPLVYVYLASDDPSVGIQYVVTDAGGSFAFATVPVGDFSVQACHSSTVCGVVASQVTSSGEAVTEDITIGGAGSVSGTVFAPDGTTPVPDAPVYLFGGTYGPAGGYSRFFYADASGHYEQANVPSGAVVASTLDPDTYEWAGTNRGALIASGAIVIDIRQSARVPQCAHTLSGSDAFVYDAYCFGELVQGGTADGRLTEAYQNAYGLRVNGTRPVAQSAARSEIGGRQVVYGPSPLAGVEATRKVFVPATGGFARFLDTITNTSNVPVTRTVQVAGSLGGAVHVLVDPSATGNTYAVTLADPLLDGSHETPATPPALAHVFGGPGGTTPLSRVRFQSLIGPSFYQWQVTIPAGESVTLMHFAVQREPTDAPGAASQAQALANLTDPNALAGMTTEEKARVVNFTIP